LKKSKGKSRTMTYSSVVALASVEQRLCAAKLERKGKGLKLGWVRETDQQLDWDGFAAQCGIKLRRKDESQSGKQLVVAGFDSVSVAFYSMKLPAVRDVELDRVIRLQAETRLPLSAQQMSIAWRKREQLNGQVDVSLAACRRDPLERFAYQVYKINPMKIVLDYEAIVRVWRDVFGGGDGDAVVMSVGENVTKVCYCRDGKLYNAATLDVGRLDLAKSVGAAAREDSGVLSNTQQDQTGQAADGEMIEFSRSAVAERFIQDSKNTIGMFGFEKADSVEVYVLSDGHEVFKGAAQMLRSGGLDARISEPNVKMIDPEGAYSPQQIYDYRVPIGLALIGFETDSAELDIFEGLYGVQVEKQKQHQGLSAVSAGVLAGVLLLVFLGVLYLGDVMSLNKLDKLKAQSDWENLLDRQKLVKSVAQMRPDMLDLLEKINSCKASDIKLESFYFKKGQLVKIRGKSGSAENIYNFQKSLGQQKGITGVKLDPSREKKEGKLDFTITFHYRNFTQKKSRF